MTAVGVGGLAAAVGVVTVAAVGVVTVAEVGVGGLVVVGGLAGLVVVSRLVGLVSALGLLAAAGGSRRFAVAAVLLGLVHAVGLPPVACLLTSFFSPSSLHRSLPSPSFRLSLALIPQSPSPSLDTSLHKHLLSHCQLVSALLPPPVYIYSRLISNSIKIHIDWYIV